MKGRAVQELSTHVVIAAAAADVWDVLVDLPRHAEWNPFIVDAEGDVELGSRLKLSMQLPGQRAMTLRPRVTVVEPGRTFEWVGHLGVPGLFDGRHRFELQPVPGGTRLIQSEAFTGVLVPLLWKRLEPATRAGFESLNEALRARVLARCGAAVVGP